MEDAHHLHQASAEAGEFGDQEDIAFLHMVDKVAKFPVGECFGSADGLFYPAVNVAFFGL